jgi:exosome complex component RRP41
MGLTVALATVAGPKECHRRADERPDRAILEVTVKAAPFAPASADRRTSNPSTDRRLLEMSHLIQRSLETAVLLPLYPRSRIQIAVSILADDGGRLCAALNAATLALQDAGIPMKDFVCACSAGVSSSTGGTASSVALVDLNRREESGPQSTMPCAIMPQRGTIVLTLCEARLPDFDAAQTVMEAAIQGCHAVYEHMQAAVRERATIVLAARSGRATVTNAFI